MKAKNKKTAKSLIQLKKVENSDNDSDGSD